MKNSGFTVVSDAARRRGHVTGQVFLVGAGPGDPGLITVRATECLALADVVLFDALANQAIIGMYAPRARRISVRKRKGACDRTQQECTALLVTLAREGNTVVRLKGGDPVMFGRGAEEAMALFAADIPFEIVPGVSSIASVPIYAGIPVTHRDCASSIGVYSGHLKNSGRFSDLEWRRIANGPDTLVFVMGKTRCHEIARKLIAFGRPAHLPAAIIFNGTLPTQHTLVGTLATLPHMLEHVHVEGPALIVIGKVVEKRDAMHWFAERVSDAPRDAIDRFKTNEGAV